MDPASHESLVIQINEENQQKQENPQRCLCTVPRGLEHFVVAFQIFFFLGLLVTIIVLSIKYLR